MPSISNPPMTENERDISLLKTDPNALLLKHRETIQRTVEQYGKAMLLTPQDIEDTIQEVNFGLLQRIPAIIRNYDGTSLLVTYLAAIIRNICRQINRPRPVQILLLGSREPEDISANNLLDRLAVREVLEVFYEVIETYYFDKSRLVLLLRVHFNLPLDEQILLWAYPKASPEDISEVVQHLGGGVGLTFQRDLFNRLAPFLNKMERKNTSGNGYYHWIGTRIPEILRMLRTRLRLETLGIDTLRAIVEEMTLHSPGPK